MRLLISEALRAVVLVAALVSFPCVGLPQSSTNVAPHFPFAYVQEGCGPEDGIALNFFFTAQQTQDGKYKEPFLFVQVNKNLPKSAPQSYTLKVDPGVLASRCLKSGSCEAATSGFLHLSKFNRGVGSSGDYEVHFKDGSLEKGTFDAVWYRYHFVCG